MVFILLDLNVRNVLLLLVVQLNIFILTHRSGAGVRLGSVQTFLLDELGVQKDQSLVHDLQGTRHSLVVFAELNNYVLSTLARELNQQTLRRFHIVGSYK